MLIMMCNLEKIYSPSLLSIPFLMYVCLHVNYNFFSFLKLILFVSNITYVDSTVESGNFHAQFDESLVLKVRDA